MHGRCEHECKFSTCMKVQGQVLEHMVALLMVNLVTGKKLNFGCKLIQGTV